MIQIPAFIMGVMNLIPTNLNRIRIFIMDFMNQAPTDLNKGFYSEFHGADD
jgi:hypothetical protein